MGFIYFSHDAREALCLSKTPVSSFSSHFCCLDWDSVAGDTACDYTAAVVDTGSAVDTETADDTTATVNKVAIAVDTVVAVDRTTEVDTTAAVAQQE